MMRRTPALQRVPIHVAREMNSKLSNIWTVLNNPSVSDTAAHHTMEQTKAPQVISEPGYSYAYSLYLHTTAWILRKAVASMTGSGAEFDAQIAVPTPGLGEGSVRCSLCLPPERKPRERSGLPLILVFEGGGFVLGQPSDGEYIIHSLSDKVRTTLLFLTCCKSKPRSAWRSCSLCGLC